MKIIYLFYFILYIKNIYSYLSNIQWRKINNFIINKQHYSIEQQQTIQKVIFLNYKNWVLKTAIEFKKIHVYKCKSISQEELNLYAFIGMSKAIQKYNPTNYYDIKFSKYASIYIISELYHGMTELQPITNIKKRYRKMSLKQKIKNNINFIKTNTHFVGSNEYIFDKINYKKNTHHITENDYTEVWSKINSHKNSNFTKKVLELKFSFEFDKIRTNREISELLCCSEETVRKTILKITNSLTQYPQASIYS
jgi:DNA-directed RNA polymerase sigma subunit (sigma70/sigma32)